MMKERQVHLRIALLMAFIALTSIGGGIAMLVDADEFLLVLLALLALLAVVFTWRKDRH